MGGAAHSLAIAPPRRRMPAIGRRAASSWIG